MQDAGWNDIRLIVERHQCIYYNKEIGRFIIERKLDQLHNAPLSVGAVFSRKTFLVKMYQEIL